MGGGVSRPEIPSGTGAAAVGAADLLLPGHTFLRLFYPAVPGSRSAVIDWLPRPEYVDGTARFLHTRPSLLRLMLHGVIGMPQVKLCWEAALSEEGGSLPVIVFSHGLGAFRCAYSAFCLDLASHGFVVAAVEHRDGSACWTFDVKESSDEHPVDFKHLGMEEFSERNPQINHRIEECVKALDVLSGLNEHGSGSFDIPHIGESMDWDQFKGRLDLSKAAVVGHSFGGGTAVGSMAADKRFKAAVALDAWMFPLNRSIFADQDAVSQPLFFLNASEFTWPVNLTSQRRFWSDASGQERLMMTLKQSTHSGMSDFAFLFGPRLGKMFHTRTEQDPVKQNRIYQRLIRAFLSKHLGIPGEALSSVLEQCAVDLLPDTDKTPIDPVNPDTNATVDREHWSERRPST